MGWGWWKTTSQALKKNIPKIAVWQLLVLPESLTSKRVVHPWDFQRLGRWNFREDRGCWGLFSGVNWTCFRQATFIRKQLKWKFIGGVEDFLKIFENRHMVDFVAKTLSVEKFLRHALRTPGVFINSKEKCRGWYFNIELHDWMLWVSFSRGTMFAYIFTMQR